MKFNIQFTQRAAQHIRTLRKTDQQKILDAVEQQLRHEPMMIARNRKPLGSNELADWELRIGDYRVFYDILLDESQPCVKIKAVGYKTHNTLYIEGKEVSL